MSISFLPEGKVTLTSDICDAAFPIDLSYEANNLHGAKRKWEEGKREREREREREKGERQREIKWRNKWRLEREGERIKRRKREEERDEEGREGVDLWKREADGVRRKSLAHADDR